MSTRPYVREHLSSRFLVISSFFWSIRSSPEFSFKIRVSVSGVKMLDTQNQLAFSQFWSAFYDEAYLNPAEERWDTYFNQRHLN